MKRLTKHLVALGLTLAMCAPVAAAAAIGSADASADGGVMLAQTTGSLKSIKSNFEDVGKGTGLQTNQSLAQIIGSVINAFMALIGIILVVIIIYAGYTWMMAQGNATKVEDAKKMITQAVIGLVILMAAYAIAQFVLGAVIKGTTGQNLESLQ